MRRRQLVRLALLASGLATSAAGAQVQPGRTFRVGLLCAETQARQKEDGKAFVDELAGLGFVEGKNLRLEWHGGGSLRPEELLQAAAELVTLKVDVITTWCGTAGAQAAKQATATIPIVFNGSADPVAMGLVASLGRPGGNVTGLAGREYDLFSKSLEMLVQADPKVKRVAVLHHSSSRALPWFKGYETSLPATGKALGVRTEFVAVSDIADLDPTMKRLVHEGVSGLILLSGFQQPPGFMEQALAVGLRYRLRIVGDTTLGALLMVYSSDTARPLRVASYTAKILRGAKPADLPVDQPAVINLSINLKTAQALGLTIPQALLLRADEVIR